MSNHPARLLAGLRSRRDTREQYLLAELRNSRSRWRINSSVQ